MTAVYPSYANVFVQDHEASNKLVIDFARNIRDFPVNQYAQVVPVKKTSGLYLVMTVEEAGRILDSTLANFVWYDGDPWPEPDSGTESFQWLAFNCKRFSPGFKMGNLTVEQATWDILAQHASIKARQAMTARTQLAVTALTTAGNYDAAHTADVTAISGITGKWDVSTTARQDIRKSLTYAIKKIRDATLSAVKTEDMRLVISDDLAGAMGCTQEIVDMVKQSPDAIEYIRGALGPNSAFNLPPKIYGVELVVEDTRKVTSKKGANRAVSTIFPTTSAALCSRPGGLTGLEGGPNFSTCQIFAQEEMVAEKMDDRNNRRVMGRVTDNVDAKLAAPASGFLFTNCQG